MFDETTYSGILGTLQRFLAALGANIQDLQHLEPSRVRFEEVLGRAQGLARRQAALMAEKQGLSLQFREALSDSQRLATMLRQGVKQQYGIRSEKLTEFGMQPFRGRQAKTEPETETVTSPASNSL
jgi:hypothetical protein